MPLHEEGGEVASSNLKDISVEAHEPCVTSTKKKEEKCMGGHHSQALLKRLIVGVG